MHRKDALSLLLAYEPSCETEQLSLEKMVAFIKEEKDCFERSLEKGHFTASCWLLSRDRSHALLTYHAKLEKWLQLGGHCDGDHDLLRVALKEAREESGILAIEPLSTAIFDVDVHEFPAKNGAPAHLHYDVRFLLGVTSDEPLIVSEESIQLGWFSMDIESFPSSEPSVVRLFNKWKGAKKELFLA